MIDFLHFCLYNFVSYEKELWIQRPYKSSQSLHHLDADFRANVMLFRGVQALNGVICLKDFKSS